MDSSQLEQLREEAARRLEQGDTAMEVLHWLRQEHGHTGESAVEIVRAADYIRRRRVRRASVRGIVISLLLLSLAAWAAAALWNLQHKPSRLLRGCALLAIASTAWLLRCVVRVITAGREEAIVWEV